MSESPKPDVNNFTTAKIDGKVTIVPKHPSAPTGDQSSESPQSVSLQYVELSQIIKRVEARSIKADGVERLKSKIERLGFQVDKPLRVYPFESGYCLIDGNHRLEASALLGLTTVPALIVPPPQTDLDAIRQARESNEAAETVVPTTFVDDAELIWRMLDEKNDDGKAKYTQQDVAGAIGWQRTAVANYKALQSISSDAWSLIVTSFEQVVSPDDDDPVTGSVTTVTKSIFTERILRNILDLAPDQQLDLCQRLVKGKDSKGHSFTKRDFSNSAENYRALNNLEKEAQATLSAVIPSGELDGYLERALDAIRSNPEYRDEWKANKAPGAKFEKLTTALIDDWQEKSSISIIVKDLAQLTAQDIPDESVDVIITDPPYPKDYVALFDTLGQLAARVLKPGGSLIAMTGQLYLPQYLELLSKHLTYHWTLAYTTPGGQAVQIFNKEVITFWKPLLWFVKGDRDGRWVSDVINTPVNANDKDHHHWGQSEQGMSSIVEKFSNPGDVVLDPFLGGGTTGLICKELNRKFIGVEIDEKTAVKAKERIHG